MILPERLIIFVSTPTVEHPDLHLGATATDCAPKAAAEVFSLFILPKGLLILDMVPSLQLGARRAGQRARPETKRTGSEVRASQTAAESNRGTRVSGGKTFARSS